VLTGNLSYFARTPGWFNVPPRLHQHQTAPEEVTSCFSSILKGRHVAEDKRLLAINMTTAFPLAIYCQNC
jgi:hypothetical protein